MRHTSNVDMGNVNIGNVLATTSLLAIACATFCATSCGTPQKGGAKSGRAVPAPAEPARDRPTPVAAGPASAADVAESAPKSRVDSAPSSRAPLAPFELLVPGTTAKLALVPIPAGEIQRADGSRVALDPFFAATTEITWDMYDAFVFAMDRAETEKDPPDAFARPSKPYILMDRGFGHTGYPVISVSFRGATEFCRWLSTRTGKSFRLPTESEWEYAARGASALDTTNLDASAWYAANSKTRGRPSTKPVGKKSANAYGLHDVLGNAAEWTVGADGSGVLRGGSFLDTATDLAPAARKPDDPAWNQTDPQIPKSMWWLADGPFAGFRVVCDP